MNRRNFIETISFSLIIFTLFKLLNKVFQFPEISIYIQYFLGFLTIETILSYILIFQVLNTKIDYKTKYYISAAAKFFPTLIAAGIILKKDPERIIESILTLVIIYLVYKGFDVYQILFKLLKESDNN